MLFNVIGYDNQVIGQVEADSAVEAWSEAGKRFDNILDTRPQKREIKGFIKTIIIKPEVKEEILKLCRRAYARESEFGMSFSIKDSIVLVEKTKWGRWEIIKIEPILPFGGDFHTHHSILKYIEGVGLEIVDPELDFSWFDKIVFLMRDDLIFTSVGTPKRTHIKLLTKTKYVPLEVKDIIQRMLPWSPDRRFPIEQFEEYLKEYIIHLDDGLPSYIDVVFVGEV